MWCIYYCMNGCEFLSIVFIFVGVILLLHHGYHHSFDHPNSKAKEESCAEACYFQIPDIANHETWIIVCFTNAFSLWVLGPWLKDLNI
jgi:hypothetical protein